MDKPTPEQWAKWVNYKSNKDLWIEAQERMEEANSSDE